MKVAHLCLLLYFVTAFELVITFNLNQIKTLIGEAYMEIISQYLGLPTETDERCDPKWIAFSETGLQADLESKLFGQHIASHVILKAVSGFMRNDNSEKPLVLSLHGTTGTGKNYVSKLIAENIYKKGMDSSFVHVFSPDYNFPSKSEIETYKYHSKLDGVSYRKAIFIFLSNDGGEIITQKVLDLGKEGRGREEIELSDLEPLISESAFTNGGFWNSHLIDRNLVDFFVPFLPLEKQHVVQCIKAVMRTRGHLPDQKVANKIVKDLVYFPKSERVFSVKGCKTIQSKVDFYM